jgi:hypothetical protein
LDDNVFGVVAVAKTPPSHAATGSQRAATEAPESRIVTEQANRTTTSAMGRDRPGPPTQTHPRPQQQRELADGRQGGRWQLRSSQRSVARSKETGHAQPLIYS